MSILATLFRGARSKRPASPQRPDPVYCRPCLEVLEDRTAPALLAAEIQPLIPPPPATLLQPNEVSALLQRAAAASNRTDAIIAVVDRGGNILGVRVENGVDPGIQSSPEKLTFAIDGAISEARTGAFFSNNQAPLTSRTIGFISQSTVSQREVESDPNITDPNSTVRGPGLVAAIGLGGHFPPGVPFTPQVDLMGIEQTNRDSLTSPGPDGIIGTADDIPFPNPTRFNVPAQFIPAGQVDNPPLSYGTVTGLYPQGQSRGMGTLPGGIPLYKNGVLVGGIGVFFPGKTGFADEENSQLNANYNPLHPDLSLVAEYMAYAAAGGSSGAGASVGTVGGVAPLPGFDLPFGSINLVGMTLNIYGPGGTQGPNFLVVFGSTLGQGNPNDGKNLPVDMVGNTLKAGIPTPQGWLVTPHAGGNLTAGDVSTIIAQGIAQANLTRAAIRLPIGQRTKMVFAVSDSAGDVLGLYRMPDATFFSIDVAVAKSRNMAYYNDPAQLVTADQVPGIPAGVAFTNRTFRYLAQSHFPEGINGRPPGPFSIMNDPGIDPNTGLNLSAPFPAYVYDSTVWGYDSFHPGTNFHDPNNLTNQNGIVFFPGSTGVYKDLGAGRAIVGGFGVSGDGVTEDDVVTTIGISGYEPPEQLRVDNYKFLNVRLPYNNYLRNPEG
jgi:uncharacterized protein GlcG (DUF336 family)